MRLAMRRLASVAIPGAVSAFAPHYADGGPRQYLEARHHLPTVHGYGERH
jgi:hypothetical protein